MAGGTVTVERAPSDSSVPAVPLSEIALTGIYEISKILSTPARLETTLSNVVPDCAASSSGLTRSRSPHFREPPPAEGALRRQANARTHSGVEGIIGDSPAIRSLLAKVEVVAKSNSPVLLQGESGTGKELIAKAIHDLSPRSKGPFIKINCAALPETVLESELFGHEKGAFTGVINSRKGRFELADGGTLFLDEIGEISGSFQAKLLRVLQEQEFERVGGTVTFKVNVRIVAATNRDLEEAVACNAFRADLYYRISVVPLMLPSLRERPGDIPLLALEFLRRFNKENARSLAFDTGAIDVMKACRFPGNVRELENCVQRTATLAEGPAIGANDFACSRNECLSSMLWKTPNEEAALPRHPEDLEPACEDMSLAPGEASAYSSASAPAQTAPAASADPDSGEQLTERQRLINAMERAGWVQAKAARILGLTPRQIGYALKKQAIPIKRF